MFYQILRFTGLTSAIAVSSTLCPTLSLADEESALEESADVEEVIVIGSRKANYTEITESTEKLVEMPGSMGDPLGAITALPGVITPAGGGEPAVRGSSPNDNRYYIDGVPAGYIFHEFNTSVLDENVIQNFQVFTAGFGAQYSGATGAVFDVRLRDPKNIDFQTTINLSLLRAGVFFESGVTENSAFYLSARQGLIQFFLPEEDEADDEGIRLISAPEDSDYQAKYVIDLNEDNSLSLLLAGAKDFAEAELTDKAGFVQENPDFAGDAMLRNSFDSQGLTWRRQKNNGGEIVLSLANFDDNELLEFGDDYFLDSTLNDVILKGHWITPIGKTHTLTVGFEHNDYQFDYGARLVLFVCSEIDVTCQDGRGELIEDSQALELTETSAYVVDRWQMTDSFGVEVGLQWNENDYTDETFYNPRVALEWQAWESVAIVSSAGRYNRLPDIETILPLFGNPNLKSPTADHFTFGLKGEMGMNWDWSVEVYHKNLDQLPLASDLEDIESDPLYTNDVEGTARGVDIFINRNFSDRWYGWMALSYSTSERTNKLTNETSDYYLDTPLVFNMVGNYQITDKWNAGFRLTAKSGQASTEIIGVKENPSFPDNYLPVYGDAYQDRLPTFAQFDIRFERDTRWFGQEGSFYIDILNATNRQNVSSIDLDYDKVNESGTLHVKKEVGFGIFPSIGFSITF